MRFYYNNIRLYFRIPAYSIVLRDENKPKKNEVIQIPEDEFHMPKYSFLHKIQSTFRFFRSTKPKEKLYMFDKPVEELQEELSDEGRPGPSTRKEEEKPREEVVQYKWKVKRRCDGTRYVVKRPIRSQILKKREAQLIRERTGLSTDDDAHSELKVGIT